MKNERGRPRKYFYRTEWLEWKANEWAHLVADVKWLKWIGRGILLAIIIKLVVDLVL